MTTPATAATDPALTIAVALGVGMVAQAAARHLRLPGIVLLLAAGVALGPDGLGVVQPAALGGALPILVGFAVAIILFEGGMNLRLGRLRREARVIRRLVTIGAAVTGLGATCAAYYLLAWPLATAVPFGTLVIVTGPTVVGPLLRRIRVERRLATILDAEGVLIDPIGAIIAVVALEVILAVAADGSAPSAQLFGHAAVGLATRLAVGSALGLVGGWALARVLAHDDVLPEGLENVFTLAMVLLLFQASDALLAESGILSVTVAGLVVGNTSTRGGRELREFKEQLTVLFIGLLFVLLAADVRLAEVRALGLGGVLVVLALMLVVRPLGALLSTAGSELQWRERAFICWLAPRGIVAAAVASLFADVLTRAGLAGGAELRALVFLVIAVTVIVQGLSGGLIARALGVRKTGPRGWLVLGANGLGLALGRALASGGEEVVFVDASPGACRAAEEASFRVLFGNALEESILLRAEIDDRRGAIGVTPNGEVNLLFARRCRHLARGAELHVALPARGSRVTAAMLAEVGAQVPFGGDGELELWALRLERSTAIAGAWTLAGDAAIDPAEAPAGLLPLAVTRAGLTQPYPEGAALAPGDVLHAALFGDDEDACQAWLAGAGFTAGLPPTGTSEDTARQGVQS